MEEKLLALIKSLKTRMDNCTEVHEYEAFEAYQYATESLEKILGESRVCKDCGNYFELTDRELAFYQRNKLFLPKRCPNCREARKSSKNQKNDKDDSIEISHAAELAAIGENSNG